MKVLDDSKLLPGDIILTTQDHYVSKAIRTATQSDISHVMLYVARGSVIDSTGEGVHARSTRRLFYDDTCAVHVRRFTGLTEQQHERIILYARSHIGTRYSKFEAVRSLAGGTSTSSQRQFCSRLVAQAYAWGGIKLVSSPDYCTPDDVKNSPLLTVVPEATIAVSDEHVAHVEGDFDTNDVMRETTNAVLEAARTRAPRIESLHDIDEYLVAHLDEDERFAQLYEDSGYLTAWQAEYNKNSWQYELPLLVAKPGSAEEKCQYCLQVLEDHGDMLGRRDTNRAGYTLLHDGYGLQTFAKLRALYEKLVDLQFDRRATAIGWLQRFAPEALPKIAAAALIPHTEEWFALLASQNPHQAKVTRWYTRQVGTTEVCSFCGDEEASNYRYSGSDVQPFTILTCKLCDDCRRIRRSRHKEEFVPMQSSDGL